MVNEARAQEPKNALLRAGRIAVLCSLYMGCGPTLIVLNKTIMHDHGFPYPMALSALGLVGSTVVAYVAVAMGWGEIRKKNIDAVSGLQFWRKIVPIGATYAITLGCGNAAYLYLDVGFVQMMKAITPVTLLLVLRLFRVEVPTIRVVQSVLVIALGTLLTTLSAPVLSIPGVTFLAGAEFAEALRLVLTQNLLVNCDFTVLEGQYFLAPVASVSLLTLSAIIEFPKAFYFSAASEVSVSKLDETIGDVVGNNARSNPLQALADAPHLFMAACVLGISVNYLGYLVIRDVGSLTLKVLGTVRNVGLVTYGAVCLGEKLTQMECAGYAVSLCGFVAYSHFKSQATTAASTQDAKGVFLNDEEGADASDDTNS